MVGALADHGSPSSISLPAGAVAALSATDLMGLHRLVRRALPLSRRLPDAALLAFERDIAGLPDSTEIERLVILRKGLARFREGLLDYRQGRCCVTELAVPELLRASHIKPWAVCTSSLGHCWLTGVERSRAGRRRRARSLSRSVGRAAATTQRGRRLLP